MQGLRIPVSLSTLLLLLLMMSCCVWADEASAGRTVRSESGPVQVQVTLTPAEPVIGDEITLLVSVTSAADVEVLMPEFGEALDRYTILDFVPRQTVAADGGTINEQRYTLQPWQSGNQMIPPILVEFVDRRPGQQEAPDDLDAYEILTDRIDFTVQSVMPAGAAAEMRPPLGVLEPQADADAAWSALQWVLFILLAAVALAAVFVSSRRLRRRVIRINAWQRARRQLDRLLQQADPSTPDQVAEFFVAISRIVRRYLEDRFGLRAPDLTTEEFLELAASAHNLSREHQELLQDFLRQADLVKFAGISASSTEVQRSSQLALRFLDETRENAPLVEQQEEDESASERGEVQEATHV